MQFPSVSSIAGVIFYGVLASLFAAFIISFVKRFFFSPSTTQVNKQKINGNGILNIIQSQNVRVHGGENLNERKEGK